MSALSFDTLATKTNIATLQGEIKLNRWMLAVIFAAQLLPMLKLFFQ